MNRDCQEKKNKEPKPRTNNIEKTIKKQCKKETERVHNHAFQNKKKQQQLTIRYSLKEQN